MSRVFVGVLTAELYIPGARTLKDRRRAVGSLVDRVRHRFDCSAALVGETERPQQQVLAVSVIGNDARHIGQILDRVSHFVRTDAEVLAQGLDVDVQRWHPATGWWTEENDDG
ncbi:MAG: DUF503 domain-containing protein [Proteobacteria bacterium]|nr:DUF503 domain-containing protein [Pseudomonadota bacterium]